MAKRTTKKVNSSELDTKEFFAAIAQIEEEKGIKKGYMLEKITQALVSAYRRDHEGVGENLTVEADEKSGTVRMFLRKEVVAEVDNPGMEISLQEAREALPLAEIGDTVRMEVKPKNFGRIAAQTARQVIIQGIREAERGMVYESYSDKAQELLTATIMRKDPNGNITVRVGQGNEISEAVLRPSEQIPGESYIEGSMIRVYVLEVRQANRGPQVYVSRTHPNLVRRLFELETPEIADGQVEIRNIAREAGSRTKMAVRAAMEGIDPVGACVGPRGGRVGAVVEELGGEKIDIVVWSENPCEYVKAALSPANVISVTAVSGQKACRVIVPDDQLSLAIGKEGQNARLAARLTGYKIDIKPASQAEPEDFEEAEEF